MIPRRVQPVGLMVHTFLVWNTRCFSWVQSETLVLGNVLWKEQEKKKIVNVQFIKSPLNDQPVLLFSITMQQKPNKF